jgi:hypothetical protein
MVRIVNPRNTSFYFDREAHSLLKTGNIRVLTKLLPYDIIVEQSQITQMVCFLRPGHQGLPLVASQDRHGFHDTHSVISGGFELHRPRADMTRKETLMHKKLIPAAIAATTLLLPLAGHAQTSQTYAGNGNSGFSGFLGLGSLTVSETTDGMITFAQAVGGPNGPSLNGNVSVFYIDSQSGGFSDTSTFTDTGATAGNPAGNADHIAISGFNTSAQRELVTFASGFQADYAVAFQDGYLDLFQLQSGDTLNYITGIGQASGSPFTFSFSASQIGLTPAQGFNFVGTLAAGNSYRSDEAIGDIGVTGNPGFDSAITFTNSNTFTPAAAPEPSGLASLLIGAALGGALLVRRRRAV